MTTAINKEGVFSIWNMNWPSTDGLSEFLRMVVYKANISHLVNNRQRMKLYRVIEENVMDEKSDGYDTPIEDSRRAFSDINKASILIQAYVNEIYRFLNISNPPVVECEMIDTSEGNITIKSNIDYKTLDTMAQNKLNFRNEMPIIGESQTNRLMWTAHNYGLDLFLGDVSSTVTATKLLEAEQSVQKTKNTINILKDEVEFPDIRQGVNFGAFDLELIFKIRSKGKKFRTWLQQEADRDRNALIAYHREVAKQSGLTKNAAKSLKMFGTLSQVLPPFYTALHPDPISGVIAAGAATGGEFLKAIGTSLDKEWRPVVFGEWLATEINKRK